MTKSKGLGRGLSALMGEKLELDASNNNGLNYVLIENIAPNPNQPRTIFNRAELEELKNSIKQNGVLQPILIKAIGNNKYQIIAGERRWRASKMLGLSDIPAIVKDISEKETLELALIENIQRENLNPLEEAESYKKLTEEHNYTQEKIAEIVSKSRSHVTNLLRLLNLRDNIKLHLKEGRLTLGHAKLLINHPESEEIASIIVDQKLNVRQTEDLIKKKNNPQNSNKTATQKSKPYVAPIKTNKHEDTLAIEESLSNSLKMPVEIDHSSSGEGKISVYFKNLQQLDNIIQKLSNSIG